MSVLPQSTAFRLLLMSAILTIGMAMKPSPYRQLLFPVMLALYLYTLSSPAGDKSLGASYKMGLNAAVMIGRAFDFLVVNEPQLTLRRKDADPKTDISKQSFLNRLWWALNLFANARGANWNFEAPNLRYSSLSRTDFVVSRIKWAAFFFVASDTLSIYANLSAVLRGDEPFGTYGFGWQTWYVMAKWASVYCSMQLGHCILSALTVALGVSSVNDWPAWHGHLGAAVSLRKFWGSTWHQALRRPLSTMGKLIANSILKYPKGSLMSSYIQLYVAFIMSGLIHAAADYLVIKNASSFKGNLLFYSSQAVIISFEDFVIACAKRLGWQTYVFPRAILHAWTIACLGLTSPLWFEPMSKMGLNFGPPVSLVGYLMPRFVA